MPADLQPLIPSNKAVFFPGESEMAERMRAFDWDASSLGSPQSWSENLLTAVSLRLTSRIPVVMYWGPEFTVLYAERGGLPPVGHGQLARRAG